MVDFVKKVQKEKGGSLHPGEEVVGAAFVLPIGSVGRSVGFGVGGLVGSAIAGAAQKKKADGSDGEPVTGGVAESIPQGKNLVLAVTPMRFLVFEHKVVSGKPGDLLLELPLGQVAAVETEKQKLTYRLRVAFSDGSMIEMESGKLAKPQKFAEAFDSLRS